MSMIFTKLLLFMLSNFHLRITVMLCVFVCFLFKQLNAQYYIGYPFYINTIPDSSKIIINKIPGASDGNFNSETVLYFKQMCQFMDMHPNFICNIYLYDFESSSFEKRLAWTKLQERRIKEFLTANDSICDFSFINDIIANGQENPIFENIIYSTCPKINKQDCFNLKPSVIMELLLKKQ